MRKALSFLGCLLLSMGTFAADGQTESLYDAAYWYADENASTNLVAATDSEPEHVTVVATDDKVVYRTIYPYRLNDDDGAPGKFKYAESADVYYYYRLTGAPYYIEVERTFPRSSSELTAPPVDSDVREIVYNLNGKLAIIAAAAVPSGDEDCVAKAYKTTYSLDPAKIYKVITRVAMKSGAPHIRVYVKDTSVEGDFERVQTSEGTYEFPTLQQYQKLTANDGVHNVAFKGGAEGSPIKVYGVKFTEENNTGFTDIESVPLTVSLDDQVEYDIECSGGSSESAIKPGAMVTITPSLKSEYAQSHSLGELVLEGNSGAVKTVEKTEGKYVLTFDSAFGSNEPVVVKLSAFKNNFLVNGVNYESFQDAVNAAIESENSEGKSISLSADVTLAPDTRHGGSAWIQPAKTAKDELVIDLKGQTLDASELDSPAIYNQGVIRIVDTVGTGKVVSSKYAQLIANGSAPDDADEVALLNEKSSATTAIVTIAGGTFVGTLENNGGVINIEGGKFLEPSADPTPAFYLAAMEGVNLGSRFTAPVLSDADENGLRFWSGIATASDKHIVAFRLVNGEAISPSYEEVADREPISATLTIEDSAKLPGYNYEKIVWTKSTGESFDITSPVTSDLVLIGTPSLIEYKISFDSGVSPITYTVESADAPLPEPPALPLYTFDGWTCGETVVNTIYDVKALGLADKSLIAKWTLKELVWSNLSLVSKTREEVNGAFPTNDVNSEGDPAFYWKLTIPAANGLARNNSVEIESISFWLVNAAPNSLARVAPFVRLGDDVSKEISLDPVSLTMRDKVRPELKYEFETPVLVRVGAEVRLSLASEEKDAKGLLRMIRYAASDSSVLSGGQIPTSGTEAKGLNREYRNYVPLFEIRGKFHEEK